MLMYSTKSKLLQSSLKKANCIYFSSHRLSQSVRLTWSQSNRFGEHELLENIEVKKSLKNSSRRNEFNAHHSL